MSGKGERLSRFRIILLVNMIDYFKNIGNAENHIKMGIFFSVGLTAASLAVPIIEAIAGKFNIKISLFDWLVVFMYGIASFFLFIGVYFNANVQVESKQEGDKTITRTTTHLLDKWTPLSKGCFLISSILFILAIIRTIQLFWRF